MHELRAGKIHENSRKYPIIRFMDELIGKNVEIRIEIPFDCNYSVCIISDEMNAITYL